MTCFIPQILVVLICLLHSRSVVLSVFQAYRMVVLPVANTWMSWSLLKKMSVTPSWPMIALLGVILLACMILGLQVGGVEKEARCGLPCAARVSLQAP